MQFNAHCHRALGWFFQRRLRLPNQTLLVMKLTLVLLTAAIVNVSAKGLSQTISFNAKNASLQEVFSVIEKQTGFTVLYNAALLDKAKPVSLAATDVPLREFLQQALKGQQLDFSIKNTSIFISSSPSRPSSHVDNNFFPPGSIKVRVTNADGQPLEGASISIKNNKNVGLTSAEGVFSLNVTEGDVLIVSFVGYQTKEVKITSSMLTGGLLAINLIPDVESLQEVVINKGYYTEARKFSTGNVATITSKEIEQQPVQNPLLALQGRVPGVEITQNTGMSEGAVTIRIEGRNSILSGLDPLVVVDGVPYPTQLKTMDIVGSYENIVGGGSPLSYINPSDIESITVLKDADATSIYGSRAANGAILITTKKGKVGPAKLSVNLQQGWGKVTRHIDMMNTRQYLDMRYEALRNDGINLATQTPSKRNYDLTVWDTTRYTDWQKELLGGTAKYSNVNASLSGGSGIMQYRIGLTFNRQTTVFPGKFDDKSGNLNFSVSGGSANQKLRVQLSGTYGIYDNHLPGVDLTQQALLLEPNAPALYNADGTLNWQPNAAGSSTWNNPLAYTQSMEFKNVSKNLLSNAKISYHLIPGMEVSSNFGYSQLQSNYYSPTRIQVYPPEYAPFVNRTASYGTRNMVSWIVEPQLQYNKTIGKGKLDGLLGGTFIQNTGETLSLDGTGYDNDQVMKNISAANSIKLNAYSYNQYNYDAVFARLNYIWNQKYVVNLTGRHDGSSRFGGNNKFHSFWSAGIGWIFSEEKWIQKNLPFINYGKLRTSYGTTGNDQISDFSFASYYGYLPNDISYQNTRGVYATNISNPNLQWEQTDKWQAGLDLGFLSNRVLLNATYVKNRSSNQLIPYILPSISGFTSFTENFPATIENSSWELSLNSTNIQGRDFKWTTSFNLTIPKNKLVSFPNIEKTSYASANSGLVIGKPLGVVTTYALAGVDPATGKYIVYDKGGNPTTSPTTSDLTNIVSTVPAFYGGFQNSFSYKGFQLDFIFQFIRKRGPREMYYYNVNTIRPGTFSNGASNQSVSVLNRWQKPGDNAEIAKYTTGNIALWAGLSDAYYTYDASYIRLKNLSLSWTLPKTWLQRAHLENARLYFQGQNLVTISNFSGLDPETGSIRLPPLQMWTIGLQMQL